MFAPMIILGGLGLGGYFLYRRYYTQSLLVPPIAPVVAQPLPTNIAAIPYAAQPLATKPIIVLTESPKVVFINQQPPIIVQTAYQRVAQYVVYFKTGRKLLSHSSIPIIIDRERIILKKANSKIKIHSKFADRFADLTIKIKQRSPDVEIEQLSREAAKIFVDTEQVDPQVAVGPINVNVTTQYT
jgi:hypothetical protein